jgi:hypothetical protein
MRCIFGASSRQLREQDREVVRELPAEAKRQGTLACRFAPHDIGMR